MKVTKLNDLLIFRDESRYASFPSIDVHPEGGFLLAFRDAVNRMPVLAERSKMTCPRLHADPTARHTGMRSADGLNWGAPEVLYEEEGDVGLNDPVITTLSDGSMLFGFFMYRFHPRDAVDDRSPLPVQWAAQRAGMNDAYAIFNWALEMMSLRFRRSEDGGRNWAGPFVTQTREQAGGTLAHRGRLAELPDGRIFVAPYGPFADPEMNAASHPIVLESSDGGRTWTKVGEIANPGDGVRVGETALYLAGDGRLVSFLRSNHSGYLFTSESSDVGRTWSHPQQRDIFGHPFHPLPLGDGLIFLAYGHRRDPFGIRARVLRESDLSPVDIGEIVLRDDGANQDLGYPWSVRLDDRRVLTVYYFNTPDDPVRRIEGTVTEIA